MSSGVDEPPGRPELQRVPGPHAARILQQLPQRDAQRRLVLTRPRDVPRQRVQREARRFLRTHRPEPVDPVEQDRRDAGDGLHVVDHRRAGVQPGHRGKRRPQPRLAAPALQRIQQRGLLAADVGARPGVHDQFQIEARAADVGAEVAGVVGLGDRGLQATQHRQHLAAHVDEGVVRPDRVGGDDGALHQEVRRRQHQRNVFARTGFRLVGVDHQVVRLGAGAGVVLRDERPFRARRKARTAAAAQTRILDRRNHVVGIHGQRLLQRPVSVVSAVGVQRPRLRLVPESAQNGCQRRHLSESVALGSVSVLRRLGWHGRRRRRRGFVLGGLDRLRPGALRLVDRGLRCGRGLGRRHAALLGDAQPGQRRRPRSGPGHGRTGGSGRPARCGRSRGTCTAARRGSA